MIVLPLPDERSGRPCREGPCFLTDEHSHHMARIESLRIYPVKSLDGTTLDSVRITQGGTLEHDRQYALFDTAGEPLTGTRTPRVHDLTTEFDPTTNELTVEVDGENRRFILDDECEAAAEWFGDVFDTTLTIRSKTPTGFVDRPNAGPSVISTATLREVSSWYDDISVAGLRQRLRANVEVGGVSAFWEDRFVGETAPRFVVDDVRFEGVEPCIRCVVPERDPETGERTPAFRRRFIERRRATFPSWTDRSAFSNDYALMLIADVPAADRGRTLHVGDDVTTDTD